jgi:hypothetical protein
LRHALRARLGIAILATASLLTAGCRRDGPVEPLSGPVPILVGNAPSAFRMDPAVIRSATITGDDLRIAVEFAGGCAEHHFSLLHFGIFMESLPVQTNVQLTHDAGGDRCRALLGRELLFDLTPLRRAYVEAYGRAGTIVIHLYEPGSTAAVRPPLRYEF